MIHSTSSHSANNAGAVTPASLRPLSLTSASAGEAQETLTTDNTASLRAALAASPEIRPEVVEKGRELANDPSYPPLAIIEGLSRLLVASQDLADHE